MSESLVSDDEKKEDNLDVPLLGAVKKSESETDLEKAFVVERGVPQSNSCRDWPWAFLFCAHLGCIVSLVFLFGVPALRDSISPKITSDDYRQGYKGYLYICLICSGCSFMASLLCLGIMMRFTESILTLCLYFSAIMSFLLSSGFFYAEEHGLGAMNIVTFLFSLFYTCRMKSHIPFSSANLKTGLRAVKEMYGVVTVVCLLVLLAGMYIALWTISLIGVYDETANCTKGKSCNSHPNVYYIVLLVIAFFWTAHVVANTIHVTVAGSVGSWWFDPNNKSSVAKTSDSLFRAMTYSFGSVCLGSIFVTIIQTLRYIIAFEEDESTLCCVAGCFLKYINRLFLKFNKWGFIYVGVYGYSFQHASKCTIELFHQRGWSSIIHDDLISSSFKLLSVVIGTCIGILSLFLSNNEEWIPGKEFEFIKYYMFFVGFFIGLVMSNIMFGLAEYSANTVLVLFAEAPFEFATNHRDSCDQMRRAWRNAYPELTGSFYMY